MTHPPRFALLALLALAALAAPAAAEPRGRPAAGVWLPVPANQLPAEALAVVRKPTLTARPPAEEFTARPAMYRWMLDHPDRTSLAWRRLNVPCMVIEDRGQGRFGFRDEHGTDVSWRAVGSSAAGRVWYAQGHAKAGPLLPTVPVRIVAVLRHDVPAADDAATIRHEVEVFFQTDSRAAALVARMLGSAAPKLAEQGSGQLLVFYSTLAKYLNKHPDRVQELFAPGEE